MQVEKSADRRVVGVFQPVTCTYVVTNCGAVTLTDIAVTDDNGTPAYAGDDLTVGTIAVLQPGATETLTRTVRLPVQLCDSGTGTPSGEIIIVDVTADGNYLATFIQAFDVNDNTYGTNADIGWKLRQGSQVQQSDRQRPRRVEFKNGAGQVVLGFDQDYISAAPTAEYPSGYGTLGMGGDGG